MKKKPLIRHSLTLATTCLGLILCLPPAELRAGVIVPNADFIDWMDPEAWDWFPGHGMRASTTPPLHQIPQPEDDVFLSRTDGVEVTLSGEATEIRSVIIGATSQNELASSYLLQLMDGAVLQGDSLIIGRAAKEGPGAPGRMVLAPGAQCDVRLLRLGSQDQNSGLSNNGFLDLEGGLLMVHTLIAGDAGMDDGSVIRIKGSEGRFDVSRRADFHGPEIEKNAAGVTLAFEFDEKGVSLIVVEGDATFTAEPQVRIDVSQFHPSKLPVSVPLVQVHGNRSGDTAGAQITGLPDGQSAVVEWSASDELLLTISK